MPEGTIHGTGLRLVKLDDVGNPTGEPIGFDGEWTLDAESEPLDLTGGPFTTQGLQWMNLNVTFCEPNPLRLALLMYGGRLVFGFPPPLPINGREYRRRVRRR